MIPNFEYVCGAIKRVVASRKINGAMDCNIVEYLNDLKITWAKEPKMIEFLDELINSINLDYYI